MYIVPSSRLGQCFDWVCGGCGYAWPRDHRVCGKCCARREEKNPNAMHKSLIHGSWLAHRQQRRQEFTQQTNAILTHTFASSNTLLPAALLNRDFLESTRLDVFATRGTIAHAAIAARRTDIAMQVLRIAPSLFFVSIIYQRTRHRQVHCPTLLDLLASTAVDSLVITANTPKTPLVSSFYVEEEFDSWNVGAVREMDRLWLNHIFRLVVVLGRRCKTSYFHTDRLPNILLASILAFIRPELAPTSRTHKKLPTLSDTLPAPTLANDGTSSERLERKSSAELDRFRFVATFERQQSIRRMQRTLELDKQRQEQEQELIPCEFVGCGGKIPFTQFDAHMLSHYSSASSQRVPTDAEMDEHFARRRSAPSSSDALESVRAYELAEFREKLHADIKHGNEEIRAAKMAEFNANLHADLKLARQSHTRPWWSANNPTAKPKSTNDPKSTQDSKSAKDSKSESDAKVKRREVVGRKRGQLRVTTSGSETTKRRRPGGSLWRCVVCYSENEADSPKCENCDALGPHPIENMPDMRLPAASVAMSAASQPHTHVQANAILQQKTGDQPAHDPRTTINLVFANQNSMQIESNPDSNTHAAPAELDLTTSANIDTTPTSTDLEKSCENGRSVELDLTSGAHSTVSKVGGISSTATAFTDIAVNETKTDIVKNGMDGKLAKDEKVAEVPKSIPCELIPCDFDGCGRLIPIAEYTKHQSTHKLSNYIKPVGAAVPAGVSSAEVRIDVKHGGEILIPCDHAFCGAKVPSSQYEQHQRTHYTRQSMWNAISQQSEPDMQSERHEDNSAFDVSGDDGLGRKYTPAQIRARAFAHRDPAMGIVTPAFRNLLPTQPPTRKEMEKESDLVATKPTEPPPRPSVPPFGQNENKSAIRCTWVGCNETFDPDISTDAFEAHMDKHHQDLDDDPFNPINQQPKDNPTEWPDLNNIDF